MVTLKLTKDQADDLYFAAGLLYQEYDEGQSTDYNLYIRRYNNSVDEIRQILKDAIKESEEECKSKLTK